MKILCMADLHLSFLSDIYVTGNYIKKIKEIIEREMPDCIVIAGDIWEYNIDKKENPYEILRNIISSDIPVVCVFGNHEFAYSSVQAVKKHFKSFRKRYGIHILDIENGFMLNSVNFIGNVFWYDSSLGDNPVCIKDFIIPEWLDSSISDFIPSAENRKCREQILKNIIHDGKTVNILITHTCPHISLNWFSSAQPLSRYNQYSGCRDFLSSLKDVKYAICGHTHKAAEAEINGIRCINIGNEYYLKNRTITYQTITV